MHLCKHSLLGCPEVGGGGFNPIPQDQLLAKGIEHPSGNRRGADGESTINDQRFVPVLDTAAHLSDERDNAAAVPDVLLQLGDRPLQRLPRFNLMLGKARQRRQGAQQARDPHLEVHEHVAVLIDGCNPAGVAVVVTSPGRCVLDTQGHKLWPGCKH